MLRRHPAHEWRSRPEIGSSSLLRSLSNRQAFARPHSLPLVHVPLFSVSRVGPGKWTFTKPIAKKVKLAPQSGQPVAARTGENALLGSLPEGELAALRRDLEPVVLPRHRILHEAGERIHEAYFLNDGMASLVIFTREGKSVEVGMVGREGVVGTPLGVGLGRGPYRAVMQISGRGFRINADALAEVLPDVSNLRLRWHRYAFMQSLQFAQIAACNRLHTIEQRLARWLLMCQDRVSSASLPVTHEFLAQMLGTGRPSVSLAAGTLQRAGTIENLRGTVRILDRGALQRAACECYHAIQHFSGDV